MLDEIDQTVKILERTVNKHTTMKKTFAHLKEMPIGGISCIQLEFYKEMILIRRIRHIRNWTGNQAHMEENGVDDEVGIQHRL